MLEVRVQEPRFMNHKLTPCRFPHLLVIEVRAGLGNRIQSLISGQRLAERMKRKLVVVWRRHPYCPAHFQTLFENNFRVVKWPFMSRRLQHIPGINAIVRYVYVNSPQAIYGVDYYALRTPIIYISSWAINVDKSEVRLPSYVKATNVLRIEKEYEWDRHCQRYIQENLVGYLKALRPRAAILQKIEEFAGCHAMQKMIGVHVRRTDFHSRSRAQDSRYIDRMKQLIGQDPSIQFFLATDNPESETFFQSHFPKQIVTYPKEYKTDRLRQTSVKDALIDMLLLARTKLIILPLYSSFSRLATCFNNTPFEYIDPVYARSRG